MTLPLIDAVSGAPSQAKARSGALMVAAPGLQLTQTVVPLTAATAAKLASARADRLFLAICNIGTSRATLGFGAAPTLNQGWPLKAAGAVGDEGGMLIWRAGDGPPLGEVYAIAAAATSIIVIEG